MSTNKDTYSTESVNGNQARSKSERHTRPWQNNAESNSRGRSYRNGGSYRNNGYDSYSSRDRDRHYQSKNRDSRDYKTSKATGRPKPKDESNENLTNGSESKVKEAVDGNMSENHDKNPHKPTENPDDQAAKRTEKAQKTPHGHYHHKNSNKPRFAKVFTENFKERKKNEEAGEDTPCDDALKDDHISTNGDILSEQTVVIEDSPLITELKVISQELHEPKEKTEDDVFEKMKSGESIELENLKELYGKIPDITKTDIISKDDEWTSSLNNSSTEAAPPPVEVAMLHKTCDIACDDSRTMSCCSHGNCCPPYFPHGYIPPIPHPAYYYAAMWNYHHPIPPPPVHRLATVPNLPSTADNGATHKRYITRSTKTPGTIVFTLHTTDSLRIVSVRSDDEFTMTADLSNEEGVKVAENFALHNPQSPKLWDQYAFSGNHSIHFNIDSPKPTVVVVTFMHEIVVK